MPTGENVPAKAEKPIEVERDWFLRALQRRGFAEALRGIARGCSGLALFVAIVSGPLYIYSKRQVVYVRLPDIGCVGLADGRVGWSGMQFSCLKTGFTRLPNDPNWHPAVTFIESMHAIGLGYLGVISVGVAWAFARLRRSIQPPAGLCAHCWYDIRVKSGSRCPEYGQATNELGVRNKHS